jgi:hypothetical protein
VLDSGREIVMLPHNTPPMKSKGFCESLEQFFLFMVKNGKKLLKFMPKTSLRCSEPVTLSRGSSRPCTVPQMKQEELAMRREEMQVAAEARREEMKMFMMMMMQGKGDK